MTSKDKQERAAAYQKAYRERHPEKFAAYRKAYRETHPEKFAAYQKAYRETHPEKFAAYWKAYRERHPEKFAAYQKAYRETHRERIAAYQKAYRETHREEIRLSKRLWEQRRAGGDRDQWSLLPDEMDQAGQLTRWRYILSRRPWFVVCRDVEEAIGRLMCGMGGVLVGRGVDQAVSRWAKDRLPTDQLVRLAERGEAIVRQGAVFYLAEHVPGNFLRITREAPGERRTRVTWWEVGWMGEDPQTLDRAIAWMGTRLRSWHGPSALSATWMRERGVKEHLAPVPQEVESAAGRAYFGGDIRSFRLGVFDEPVQKYDMNSAYAWSLTYLPSFRGRWEWIDGDRCPSWWSVCRVSWDVGIGTENPLYPVTPFPWRGDDALVCYPPAGTGWYWSPLVRQAQTLWGKERIQVHERWAFMPDDPNVRPFAWLKDLYRYRRQAGEHLSSVLKTAMSSVYGKLVQGPGKWPNPYQHLAAAGLCTAMVRARVLWLAARHPRNVISALTDCLWMTGNEDVGLERDCLGSWRHTALDGFAAFSPNCYRERRGEDWVSHAAGAEPNSACFSAYPALGRRKVLWTPALCHAQGRWANLGEVIEEPVELPMRPGGGFSYPDDDGPNPFWHSYHPGRSEEYASVCSHPYRKLDK